MSSSATSYNYKECKSCHLPLNDGQAYKLGTDQWHVACFKCSKCSKALGVDSNFLVLGTGALVCSDCSYTCKSCNKKIYDLAILTGDLAYCADCFKCKSCNKPIDDLKYARTSKGLFCMPCHNMLMEKKKKYEKIKKLKAAKEKEILDRANKRLIEQKVQRESTSKLSSLVQPSPPSPSSPPPPPPPPQKQQQQQQQQQQQHEQHSSVSSTITNGETIELSIPFERPPIPLNKDHSLAIGSNQSSSYSHAANSSTSTFDLDDYVNSSNTKDDEIGSSVYSKTGASTGTVDDNKSLQESLNINSSLEILDSANLSPAQKLNVVLDYDRSSPVTAIIEQTPTFENNSTEECFTKSTPVNIPNLQPNFNNRLSFLASDNHNNDSDSDLGIPLRSPKRGALSPVRNTTQFRTPELSTPKKKASPVTLMSPSSIHRQAHIFDDTETEQEPESFINLDETEEESLVSKESDFESMKNDPDPKLLSPIKYNVKSFDMQNGNVGLNIKGIDLKESSNETGILIKGHNSDLIPAEEMLDTPVANSQPTFESNDKITPNSKKKPIGGLGRSLTKVFGRGRKPSNDFQGQGVSPNLNNGDLPATPETITSRKSSVITNNFDNTPQRHTRTQSDHSVVAFTTPPVPQVRNHTRSISETISIIQPDIIQQTTNELQLLKTEINSLTLTKATILRDIQNLRVQMRLLELDLCDKQNILKDLDSSILLKQKLNSTDELSLSNNSTASLKNSSRDELTNLKMSSTEYVYEEPTKVTDSSLNQQVVTPPSTTSTTSMSSHNTFNPYSQLNSSTSQSRDKRTGFMRRIFGTHSNLNSATSVGPNSSSTNINNMNTATPVSLGNISQPMNVRHNDESSTYADLANKNLSNSNNNEASTVTSGIKSSRSANFMQWRSTNNNNNNNNNNSNNKSSAIVNNSSENLLFNLTLQELVNSEGSSGVPFIIKTCINEVERRGLKIEGIYRISASTSTVEKLEHFFESLDINNSNDISKMHSLIDTGDIHAMAGLLKRYLKKIPDSIIPQELYDSYINVSTLENDEKRIEKLTQIITFLPKANKSTLFILSKHLSLIADNEKFNKMNSASLATVFAPTLVRHNSLHPTQEIHDTKNKTSVTELLFKNYTKIFA